MGYDREINLNARFVAINEAKDPFTSKVDGYIGLATGEANFLK